MSRGYRWSNHFSGVNGALHCTSRGVDSYKYLCHLTEIILNNLRIQVDSGQGCDSRYIKVGHKSGAIGLGWTRMDRKSMRMTHFSNNVGQLNRSSFLSFVSKGVDLIVSNLIHHYHFNYPVTQLYCPRDSLFVHTFGRANFTTKSPF